MVFKKITMKMIKFSFFSQNTCWKCIITLLWVRLIQMWSISFMRIGICCGVNNFSKYQKIQKNNPPKKPPKNRFLVTTINPPPKKKRLWKFNSNKKAILFSNYLLKNMSIIKPTRILWINCNIIVLNFCLLDK